jgi:hypothetical protein
MNIGRLQINQIHVLMKNVVIKITFNRLLL